jgi:hypothetical protein
MDESPAALRMEEYRSLQEEHRRNRHLVFERPLIILGTVALAMQYLDQSRVGSFLAPCALVALGFNLWFTRNRLASDARIVAYIQILHEQHPDRWFGWESALFAYRAWRGRPENRAVLDEVIRNVRAQAPRRQAFRFYPVIWILHLVLMVLVLLGGVAVWLDSAGNSALPLLSLITVGASALGFGALALRFFRPSTVETSIEEERAIWQRVLKLTVPPPEPMAPHAGDPA